jgi:hypothetical protein
MQLGHLHGLFANATSPGEFPDDHPLVTFHLGGDQPSLC